MFTNRLFRARNIVALACIASASLLVGGTALASGTATSNLSVTASVDASCTISTAAVAFGAYDPIVTNAASPLVGTGTITVTCTNGASTTITLGAGGNEDTGSTDDVPLRQMNDGGSNLLAYFLYSDPGRTTVWGNTEEAGKTHLGTGTSTDLTVFGRVPAGQNVPAGSYSDTVVATVTF